MGELTEVASAKRAARGVLIDSPSEDVEEFRDLTVTLAAFLSSSRIGFSGSLSIGETLYSLLNSFDISISAADVKFGYS